MQETRGWDDAKQKTNSQRSKEDAQDYRYMPDADIPPIILSDEEIAEIQSTVPKLPDYYREAWKDIGFDQTVVDALLLSRDTAETLDNIYQKSDSKVARRSGFWLLKAVTMELESEDGLQKGEISIDEDALIKLAQMVDDNKLNSNAGDEVFFELLKNGGDPEEIAERKNLIQVSDEGAIAKIVDEVLADPASAQSIEDIKAGKEKAIGFLVGQVMKKSQGKANPGLAQKLIKERLQ